MDVKKNNVIIATLLLANYINSTPHASSGAVSINKPGQDRANLARIKYIQERFQAGVRNEGEVINFALAALLVFENSFDEASSQVKGSFSKRLSVEKAPRMQESEVLLNKLSKIAGMIKEGALASQELTPEVSRLLGSIESKLRAAGASPVLSKKTYRLQGRRPVQERRPASSDDFVREEGIFYLEMSDDET